MNNHSESLVVQIDLGDGTFRDALPVRSIPHVTGWVGDFGVPPLEVAIRLQTNINLHAWEVVAYRLLDGKPVAIQPRQWEMVETQLAGFSKKLHRLYPRDEHHRPSDEGLAEWQSQATEKLPARAFVWLDEFKAEYLGWYRAKFKTRPNLVIPEFDLTPLLSEEVSKMVLEGFEQPKHKELAVVEKLFDEIERLKIDIDDWKSTDHSKTADRLVLKQQLAPLESRLTELDEEKRVLRGDYLDLAEVPQSVVNGLVLSQDAPVAAAAASVIHSTKARRNTLTPVIELAQSNCRNQKDTAEVWAALQVLAEKKTAPLIGATEEGLQYLKAGVAEIFTRKSLGQRLAR